MSSLRDIHQQIHHEIRPLVEAIHHPSMPKMRKLSVPDARAFADKLNRGNKAPLVQVGDIHSINIPGPEHTIAANLLLPPEKSAPYGVIVWLHGGGWVLGTLEDSMRSARKVCAETGAAVLTVDYRLAPEHIFPAAVEDAFASVRWVSNEGSKYNLDPTRVAVGGESAGGNLAAVCALAARDGLIPELTAQMLVYPVLDNDFARSSYETYSEGLLLETPDMKWFWDHYHPEHESNRDWRAMPIAAESLRGVAPTIMVIADLDPLRSENEHYVERLRADDVAVEVIRLRDVPHGSFGFGESSKAIRDIVHQSCGVLASHLKIEQP